MLSEAVEAPRRGGGTDQKGHLRFTRTAFLFHENRALSFPKKGTFSPGILAPNAPRYSTLQFSPGTCHQCLGVLRLTKMRIPGKEGFVTLISKVCIQCDCMTDTGDMCG